MNDLKISEGNRKAAGYNASPLSPGPPPPAAPATSPVHNNHQLTNSPMRKSRIPHVRRPIESPPPPPPKQKTSEDLQLPKNSITEDSSTVSTELLLSIDQDQDKFHEKTTEDEGEQKVIQEEFVAINKGTKTDAIATESAEVEAVESFVLSSTKMSSTST